MEGDAGASRLNPADTDDSSSEPHEAEQTSTETTAEGLAETESEAEVDLDTETEAEDESEGGSPPVVEGNPSRLGRGWLIGVAAALLVLAGGIEAEDRPGVLPRTDLIERLLEGDAVEDDVEDARWLRAHVGKVGYLQLGWAYQGSMFLCELSTEWYDRYQRLLEVSDEFGGLTMDEPDQDEEN